MFTVEKPQTLWSTIGIRVLIGSVIASVILALADGVLQGIVYTSLMSDSRGLWKTLAVWALDFRYLADQAIYASVIFIVGRNSSK